MNKRKKFLAAMKAAGYTGADDAASVKSWLAENPGIAFFDSETNKDIDVDAVFAKKTVYVAADAGEDVQVVEAPAKSEPMADDEEPVAAPAKSARSGRAAISGVNAKSVLQSPEGYTRMMARKRYAAKVATGQAYMPDADYAEGFGAWLRYHSAPGDYSQKAWDAEVIGKTGTTTNNAAIGALIPEEYSAIVIDVAERFGVALRVANLVKMGRDVWTAPRSTAYMTLTHTTEGSASTAADPAYDNVTLTAKTARGLSKISNEALEDAAVNVADEYARQYSIAYARRIDQDYIIGDGTSTYGGHSGLASALPSGAYIAAAGAWTAHTDANITSLIGSVENVGDNNGLAFICSRQYYTQVLQRLAQAKGGVTATEIVAGVSAAKGPDARYQGWPVYFAQVAPTVTASSAKSVYFGDFRAASMIGQRGEFRIRTSEDRYFDENNFGIMAICRFAVNVHGDGRASTFGPITCLQNP